MAESNIIKVGMADLKHTFHPGVLVTLGLGSCVGIALYDTKTKMIGLAHIMLPWSEQAKNKANKAKFADTGIRLLLENMLKDGADKKNIVAKIAGGAQMFSYSSLSDMIRVGERNVEATKKVLKELNIPLIAEDTGGTHGRTIEFYSEDGRLMIKTIGFGVTYI
ncbi:chemotaxis protein CheD [Thermoclostridium stercorarium subsp. thermolacticum DSM 2910]|nr:chemotaxis protein CheD [Thermoclostridium stercorarium]AGI38779.1 chemotaxis protein [Thermoclostridium stercorarium subsp. stercorarium DSM 8532]ANW98142.1 chemotaxis protein CheD [Thermoclostridium stercorarium subsp. thermolacticum DSM 2910]ANX00681.1 chemotaxis protein CheD [Thermoclostridium stercorarium subsp. leptospartum DSM 9219]UZQ86297.1 chemotaxis protein CheD [Thermoclostridium stercorarium]